MRSALTAHYDSIPADGSSSRSLDALSRLGLPPDTAPGNLKSPASALPPSLPRMLGVAAASGSPAPVASSATLSAVSAAAASLPAPLVFTPPVHHSRPGQRPRFQAGLPAAKRRADINLEYGDEPVSRPQKRRRVSSTASTSTLSSTTEDRAPFASSSPRCEPSRAARDEARLQSFFGTRQAAGPSTQSEAFSVVSVRTRGGFEGSKPALLPKSAPEVRVSAGPP